MYFEFRIDYLDYNKRPTTKYKCISDVYDTKRNISIIYQYKDWIKAHQDYMTKYYFYIVLLDDNFRFIKTIK